MWSFMTRARMPGGERGASILELALVAPVMILIVMGVLDLARGYQMQIRLENAAREGAAYAQLYPSRVECADGEDVVSRVTGEEEGVDSSPDFRVQVFSEDADGNLTVPVTGCDSDPAAAGSRIKVTASATFDVLTPMVERVVGDSIAISGSAEIEVQG